MREASSLVLSSRLQGAGARVRAYDPVAEDEARKLMRGVEFADSAADAVAGADAVVLVTEWPEFRELDLVAVAGAMRGRLLVDGRNFFDPRPCAPPGSPTRRSAGPSLNGDGVGAGADPRRRRGDAAAAADLRGPEAGRARSSTARSSPSCSSGCAATAWTT